MATSGLIVRDYVPGDLPALTRLYGRHVLEGTASFEYAPPSEAEMAERLEAVEAMGLPRLVAGLDGRFAGYALATPFRPRAGYRFTAEDAVYVESELQGRGVGRALLEALAARCEALGLRQLTAVIGDSGNRASIALHRRCGFVEAGRLRDIGWKQDGWRDVVLMQRALGPGAAAPPEAPGLRLPPVSGGRHPAADAAAMGPGGSGAVARRSRGGG